MNLTLLKPFTKVLAVLMGFILLIGAPAANPEGWQNDLPEDTKLAFNVIADVHMETTNKYSRNVAVKIFRNMKEHSSHKDALVMLGDNTMNGKYSENLFLYGLLADIKPADRYLAVCGNHDTGNLGDVYNNVSVFKPALTRYLHFQSTFDTDVRNGYFTKDVNGYTFIFLYSEADTDSAMYMSEEQLNWFEEQMDLATADGKPVFVVCHYPYADIEDMDDSTTYENDGYADRVEEILTSHKNVFYFCGHWHTPWITLREEAESVYFINMPRVTDCDEDDGETWYDTGLGVQVTVTGSEVILEGVNFYTCELDEERAVVPII